MQHAERVLRVMDLHDQIEGIVFCDYGEDDLICKPAPASYHRVGFVFPTPCHETDLMCLPDESGYAAGRGAGPR